MNYLRPARVVLLTLAAVLLVSLMLGRSDEPAKASHEPPDADGVAPSCGPLDGSADDILPTLEPCVVDFVQIDVDPTGNTGSTLSDSHQNCREVASSASFDVDIVVDALPDITPAGPNNAFDGVNNFNDGATFIQAVVEYDNNLLTLGTVRQYLEEIFPGFGTPSILGIDPDSSVGIAGNAVVTELDPGAGAANRVVVIYIGPDLGDAPPLPRGRAAEEGIMGVFVRLPFTAIAPGVAEAKVLGSFGPNSTKVIQVDNGLFTIANLYGPDGGTGGGLSADDEDATSFIAINTPGGCTDTDGDGVPDSEDDDDDNDGIPDEVDGRYIGGSFVDESLIYSDSFTDEHLLGMTSGTIDTRGGLTLTVSDLTDPAGVQISVSDGGGTAKVRGFCAPVTKLTLTSGDVVDLTCTSASVSVLAGPVEAEFGTITATLPTGTAATITETAPGVFQIVADPGNSEPIGVGGLAVGPGETVSVTDSDGDGIVDSVDPDDDGDGVPDGEDVCPGFNDNDDADSDATPDGCDACPDTPGLADRQGCPYGDDISVTLHTVDQPKTTCPGGAGSCRQPVEGAEVRVFDRSLLGTQNPPPDQYDDTFEADVHRIATCTTDSTGQCIAGEETTGDYLVIAKFVDGSKTVYVGSPKSDSSFVDGLAEKDLHVLKVIKKKDGSVQYSGGRVTTVDGSYLEIVYSDFAIWEDVAAGYVYPFIFSSDSDWNVDICAYVPTGYAIVGAYDDEGNFVADVGCAQTFVTAETKVLAFEVVEVGSPEPVLGAILSVEHEGEVTDIDMEVPGVRTYVEPAGEEEAQPAQLPTTGAGDSGGGSVPVWPLVAVALAGVALLGGGTIIWRRRRA